MNVAIKQSCKKFKPDLIALAISQALICASSDAAVINVDSPPGGCTLFKAISTANDNTEFAPCEKGVGDDTINLPANTTFDLSAGPALGGLPIITSTITINGNGSTLQRDASATEPFSLLHIENANLSLNDLVLSGGRAYRGGGIYAESSSSIFLSNITISDNEAEKGAGLYAYSSSVNLSNSTVYNNTANYSGGGGLHFQNSRVTLSNSTVHDNSATRSGGGISIAGGSIELSNSIVASNSSSANGGGIEVSGSSIGLLNSTVSGNSTGDGGGGIHTFFSSITLSNSTVIGNSSNTSGGGLAIGTNSSVVSYSSTISGNSSGQDGGAIRAFTSSSITLVNNTLSGNIATTKGGAIHLGGVVSDDSSLTINNSTIINNRINSPDPFVLIDSGGGIFISTVGSNSVTIANTVIANNGPSINDCGGVKPGQGLGNWFQDSSCSGGSILSGQGDPKLGELADNGGPTKTHAPLPGSGLEGTGNFFICSLAPVNGIDQRGEPRNNPCFIGAVEGIIDPSSFYVIPLENGKTVIIPL